VNNCKKECLKVTTTAAAAAAAAAPNKAKNV